MKLLLHLLVVATLAILVEKALAQDPAKLEAATEHCAKSNGISPEELEAMKNRQNDDQEVEQKHKCFAYCFLKETDKLTSDGKIDEELIQNSDKIDDNQKNGLLDCKSQVDGIDEDCEYGFRYLECAVKLFPKE